jgi:serine/threonine-protein kinase
MDPVGDSSAEMANSPTLTARATQIGMILGTAAYMAPEQAKGKHVDKRADIWAFGAVLFEVLTGQRAFAGSDVSEVLASVLAREPDWTQLPGGLSPVLDVYIRRCLHKDPRQRIPDIATMRLALEGAFETAVTRSGQSEVALPPRWRRALPLVATSLVVALVVGFAVSALTPPDPRPVVRSVHAVPEGRTFRAANRTVIAIAPDGRYFVYNGSEGLSLRALDTVGDRIVPGTEEMLANPFVSPNGEAVAFSQAGQLKRMAVTGGAAQVLTAATPLLGASWEADGTILYGQADGIWQVSENGGEPQHLIAPGEDELIFGPQRLPGGEWVLFTAASTRSVGDVQIVVQSVRTGDRRVVLSSGRDGRYLSTGHLVYSESHTLFAVPFDPVGAQTVGVPGPVVPNVGGGLAGAHFSVADNGTLVFVPHTEVARQLVWVDRAGRESPVSQERRQFRNPRLSPDGRVAAVVIDGDDGVNAGWFLDLERNVLQRIDVQGDSNLPIFAPDGNQVVFARGVGARRSLYRLFLDGRQQPELLVESELLQIPTSWSSDGQYLVYVQADPVNANDIWMLPMENAPEPQLFLGTPSDETQAALSPSGEWIAYRSDASGRNEIYVEPFPAGGLRQQVSPDGGTEPVWARNGREIFYRVGTKMMVVDVTAGADLELGAPRELFEEPYELTDLRYPNYDVDLDGERFLMVKAVSAGSGPQREIIIVQNWFEELKRLVPVR